MEHFIKRKETLARQKCQRKRSKLKHVCHFRQSIVLSLYTFPSLSDGNDSSISPRSKVSVTKDIVGPPMCACLPLLLYSLS
jgi:hypothetical protein